MHFGIATLAPPNPLPQVTSWESLVVAVSCSSEETSTFFVGVSQCRCSNENVTRGAPTDLSAQREIAPLGNVIDFGGRRSSPCFFGAHSARTLHPLAGFVPWDTGMPKRTDLDHQSQDAKSG